jgi:enoyl-CoA hydratase
MSQSKEEPIQYEVANKVATIWLNRPHKRNCVSPLLLEQIALALDRAEKDSGVLAVVVRGRGNTFCAGADLDELLTPNLQTTNGSIDLAMQSGRHL